jgi:hypothetical protein
MYVYLSWFGVTSIPLEEFCVMYMHYCDWCKVNTGYSMLFYFQVLKLVILVQNLVCILLIMASLDLKMFAFLVRICWWKIPRYWRYVTHTWLPSQDNFIFEFQFQIYIKITLCFHGAFQGTTHFSVESVMSPQFINHRFTLVLIIFKCFFYTF